MPALELQSGFVVAVVLGAIFLADRFPPGALMERVLQCSIALALLLTVAAGTEAVVPSANVQDIADDLEQFQDDPPDEEFFNVSEDIANDDDVRAMIQFAVAVGLVVAGGLMVGRFRVIPTALVFGGLLLLLTSGSQGGGDVLSELLDFVIGDSASSSGYDIARFFVFLLGTLALLWMAYMRFEEPRPQSTTAGLQPSSPPPDEPPPSADPFVR